MSGPYKVRVRVASVQGTCAAEHKVGDSWMVEDKSPAGICLGAFSVISPYLRTLRFGGEFPWSEDKDATVIACPDSKNPVTFEIRRMRD